MSEKPVTTAQLEQIRKMAREKGVGKDLFQEQGLDGGIIAQALEAIRLGLPITIGIPIIPPPGCRVHILKGVRTQLDREWQEAVTLGGPQTPDHYDVRKVANLYQPTGSGVVEEDHILLNYSKGDGSFAKALAWATTMRLIPNDPRRVFASSEQNPNLHHELGVNPMYVVAPVECPFEGLQRACYSWWVGAGRRSGLLWVSDFDHSIDWFSFRK